MELNLPKVYIRSKNELAKHLSTSDENLEKRKHEIKTFFLNPKGYYYNHPSSVPEEGKFIRISNGPLKSLNKGINEVILKPLDKYLPYFIFGGITGKNHIKAVQEHKTNKSRTYLKLDLKRYFDQITIERVTGNLVKKLGCSREGAFYIASLCCVPEGEFYDETKKKLVARGFHTSSRLAVLCSIEFFQRLGYLLKNDYSHLNPKISVYVDDITISINNTERNEIDDILKDIYTLADKYQLNLNKKKEEIIEDTFIVEILGIKLKEGKMSLGKKSKSNRNKAYMRWNKGDKDAIKSIKGFKYYRLTLLKSSI